MNLPIKFPKDADVAYEEAARFRALSPEARMNFIRGVMKAGALMLRQSPNAEYLRQYALEQEELARRAVKELIARHAE